MVDRIHRTLILGDFHFGESYRGAGAQVLADKGYSYSTKYLLPFINSADKFIVNLETPLVDAAKRSSPLQGKKTYIHWAEPSKTPQALKELGVDAVSLANNHTLDHGRQGLLSTFEHLAKVKIPWFGAGRDLAEAHRPYVIPLPLSMGGGEIHFHGSFQYSRHHDLEYEFYASDQSPGCAPLTRKSASDASILGGAEDTFHVSFPHWGANYDWRTPGQARLARHLLEAGFDLILGHGSHCVQEIVRSKRRWTVHSIGNGNFQSGGRFEAYRKENGIAPYGLWSILEITLKESGDRRIELKLYPVYSDNKVINYRPRPVAEDDFVALVKELKQRSRAPWHFENEGQYIGSDKLGHFIGLDLGIWPICRKPSRLAPLGKAKEISHGSEPPASERTYNDADTIEILKQYGAGRNLGAILIARAAERAGSEIRWVANGTAVATGKDREFLISGYKCDESDLGARIVQDKYLLKKFLQDEGVPTPNGFLAASAIEATAIATKLGCPVVVKPRFGNKGKGISVNLSEPSDIQAAFDRAFAVDGAVLVEEYIPLEDEYRCLATAVECVSVVKRILPNVTGDGESTIRELVEGKNEARKLNPALYKRYIPIDSLMERNLRGHGLGLADVLEAGRTITVRDVGGLSSGGEPHEFSELVSEDVKLTAYSAVRAVPGLTWGGADVITSRVSGRPYVIEINSDADISGATYPLEGPPTDVASQMWQLRVDSSARRVDDRPRVSSINSEMPAVRELLEKRYSGPDVRLASAFFDHLSSRGVTVEDRGPGILKLVSTEGETRWLTSEAMGRNDLSAVRRVVRRHSLVRRLLREAKVPRVLGKVVRSATEANDFIQRRGAGAVLMLPGDEWDNRRTVFAEKTADFREGDFDFDSPGFIQEHSALDTVRVLATAGEALAILGRGSMEFSDGLNERVSALAVKSVRAIPQLRWGSIDIRIKGLGASEGGAPRILVSGITLSPRLDLDWQVLAGSLSASFDLLNPFN